MICPGRLSRLLSGIKADALTRSAFVLAAAGLLSKCIGAAYRLLLTSVAGAESVGIYQTVFPVYCVLLTFSSTGVPSGISKLVAEGGNDKKLAYKSIILFGSIGLIGSLLMFVFSFKIASGQGEVAASSAYRCLAPSVFVVSVISVFRGVFQGRMNMYPTAVSQVVEQIVKAAFGTAFSFLGTSPSQKASLAALAVTLSEVFALSYLVFASRKYTVFAKGKEQKDRDFLFVFNKPLCGNERKFTRKENANFVRLDSFFFALDFACYKKILLVVLPVTLSVISLPLLRLVDSFTVVNYLKTFSPDATGLYGLYTGGAESVVSLPVSLCYGIAASAVPLVARTKSNESVKIVLSRTFVLSSFCSLAVVLFAPLAVKILFFSLSPEYSEILVNLLRFSCVNVLLLGMIQSLSAVLIAFGKPLVSFLNVFALLPLKIFINFLLVRNPSIGIYGCAFSDTACFFVAGLLDLLYIIRRKT